MHRFWDIRLVSIVTLKPGLGITQVIENDTIQSGTHSNIGLSRTVSGINGDFRWKSPNFPTPRVFIVPLMGVPLEFRIGARGRKYLNDGIPDGRKSFKMALVVYTQYRLWQTATQPATSPWHIRYRAMLGVARVKHSRFGFAWSRSCAGRGLSRPRSIFRTTNNRCVQNFIQIGWDLAVWGPKTCFWVKTEHGQAYA